jgi:hypothetical protein
MHSILFQPQIEHVLSGKAGPQLLDLSSVEREPVGAEVITAANQGLRYHMH